MLGALGEASAAGAWDLRIVLLGRKPAEVRSCCRSEDRPHIDALDHRLYSVRGDTQAFDGPAGRVLDDSGEAVAHHLVEFHPLLDHRRGANRPRAASARPMIAVSTSPCDSGVRRTWLGFRAGLSALQAETHPTVLGWTLW